jgi:preprotein translocase subunit SecE
MELNRFTAGKLCNITLKVMVYLAFFAVLFWLVLLGEHLLTIPAT